MPDYERRLAYTLEHNRLRWLLQEIRTSMPKPWETGWENSMPKPSGKLDGRSGKLDGRILCPNQVEN